MYINFIKSSNLSHFQCAMIASNRSRTFRVNDTCWFVLHGISDNNGSLFTGGSKGRLYTLCGIDSSNLVAVSVNDGILTITNNIGWGEFFIVFG